MVNRGCEWNGFADARWWVRADVLVMSSLPETPGRRRSVVPTIDTRTVTQHRPDLSLAINSAADFDALSVDPFCFVGAEESDHAADVVGIAHAPEG